MTVIGEAFVDVRARTDNFAKDAEKGVTQSLDKASAGGGVKSAALKLGAVIGGALSVKAGADFLKGTVDLASSLNESMSKVQVVFGDAAGSVEDWADRGAKAFGQSKIQALEAAGTYGNLFRAFGVAAPQAKDMSTGLVELAADMASFNNTSIEDALAALQSGVSGETEPLKRFGVALTDDRLKLEAVRLGLIATTKDGLDPAAKAQAIYSLIMKDTALAQGDFARTSDGLANQQRIVAAEFANAKTELGQRLLPVQLAVTKAMSQAIPVLLDVGQSIADGIGSAIEWIIPRAQAFGEWIGPKLVVAFEAFRTAAEATARVIEDVVRWLNENRDVAMALGIFVGTLTAAILAYNTAVKISEAVTKAITLATKAWDLVMKHSTIGIIVTALAALAAGLYLAYQRSETFRDVVHRVMAVMTDIGAVLSDVIDVIMQVGRAALPILTTAFTTAAKIVGEFIEIIQGVIDAVMGVVDVIVGVFSGDWARAWDGMKQIVSGAIDVIVGYFIELPMTILSALAPLGGLLWDAFRAALDYVGSNIDNWIVSVLVFQFVTVPLKIVGALADLGSVVWDGIKAGFDYIAEQVGDWAEGLVSFVGELPERFVTALADIGSVVWGGIVAGFTYVKDNIANWAGEVVDYFVQLPGRFVEGLGNIGQFVWDGIQSGFETLKSNVASVVDEVVGFFTSIPGRLTAGLAAIGTAAKDVGEEIVSKLIEGVRGIAGQALDFAGGLGSAVLDAFESVWNKLVDHLNRVTNAADIDPLGKWGPTIGFPDNMWNWLKLQTGGIVPGGPGQAIPALLHGGEAVFTEAQQSMLGRVIANAMAYARQDVAPGIIAALDVMRAAFETFRTDQRADIRELAASMREAASAMKSTAKDLAEAIRDLGERVTDDLEANFLQVYARFDDQMKGIHARYNALFNVAKINQNLIVAVWDALVPGVKAFLESIPEAQGGGYTGSSGGLWKLHPNEWILNERQMRSLSSDQRAIEYHASVIVNIDNVAGDDARRTGEVVGSVALLAMRRLLPDVRGALIGG